MALTATVRFSIAVPTEFRLTRVCFVTGFFDIEQLPKKVAVVGAGYIAVELAGVLNVLGSSEKSWNFY